MATPPLLLALGSGLLLIGAFGFQYIGGLSPCTLCLWQRFPYAATLLLGLIAAFSTRGKVQRILILVMATLFFANSALALYHAGVEWKILPGPTACTGGGGGAETIEDLKRRLAGTHVVRCDEAPWVFLGLSLAGWNAIAAFGLGVLALRSSRRVARIVL
ncbi:MAG: disulfide bond formation protein B [Alphaproteobacteria bacterium]